MTLGDKCKWLEKNFSPDIMVPTLPVIIRLDGVNFSKWTKGLAKPFDNDLTMLMGLLTKAVMRKTNAVIGYTQSDEITLILYTDNWKSEMYHAGKKQKILSKLSSYATNVFNEHAQLLWPERPLAEFDCRVYQVPSMRDACLQLLWREQDAVRNSIQAYARSVFSHEDTIHKNGPELQDMLIEQGLNWNNFDPIFKRGMYIKKFNVERAFTPEELIDLPPGHKAHRNPELKVNRTEFKALDLPKLSSISNKVDVVFFNAEPKVYNR